MEDVSVTTLAIIGTAGRRDDMERLDRQVYDRMTAVAREILAATGATALISGGAAWADHVAVRLAVDGVVPASQLTLHFPAPFGTGGFDRRQKDGSTANHYHRLFSEKAGLDSLGEIAAVLRAGAASTVSNGFFVRNARVAKADAVLAFTFGRNVPWSIAAFGPTATAQDAGLKDGGTAHTWDRSRSTVKIHVSLG